jgi:hypothetical protein
MNKEELIKLLESLTMEEIISFEINYYKEKDNSYGYPRQNVRKMSVIEFNKIGGNNE